MRYLLPIAAVVALAAPAQAQLYTLQTSGTLYSLYGDPGYTNDGRIAANSSFTVTLTYNTSAAVSSTTTKGFDSEAIYTLPTTYSYTVGSYSQTGNLNGILIVDDNHDLGGGFIEDGVAFVSNNGPYSTTPFGFDGKPVYTSFQVNSYDTTLATLNGTDLGQVSKYGNLARQFVTFGFVNSTFTNSVNLFGNVTSSVFYAGAPAVPEPATWAMMILGMGAIGFAMRRRQKVITRVSYAA